MCVNNSRFSASKHHGQYFMSQLSESKDTLTLVRAIAHLTHYIMGGMGGVINNPEFFQDSVYPAARITSSRV